MANLEMNLVNGDGEIVKVLSVTSVSFLKQKTPYLIVLGQISQVQIDFSRIKPVINQRNVNYGELLYSIFEE